MKVEKKEKTKEVKNCVSVARYEYKDTGEIHMLKVRDADGIECIVEKPIKEKIFKDAVYETIFVKETVYVVNDGIDDHEFLTQKEAKEFLKRVK